MACVPNSLRCAFCCARFVENLLHSPLDWQKGMSSVAPSNRYKYFSAHMWVLTSVACQAGFRLRISTQEMASYLGSEQWSIRTLNGFG